MAAVVLTSTEDLSREQWLEFRRRGIGGSDASVICEVNKYKSPIELWLEKTGQAPNQEAGEAAHWGNLLEPLVRDEFTERTGLKVKQVSQLLQSKEYPFMLANLDGVLKDPKYGPCVFEAKTASAYKIDEWEDSIPVEYNVQIQHYMAVTGYSGTYIAVLIGGNTFKWAFVERDEASISMLIQREADFWSRVVDGVPPLPDGSDACTKFLSQRYQECVPKSQITLPASACDLILQYSTANEQVEAFTKQKQQAANTLKEMLGNNEIGVIGDSSISWKSVSQERFDSKTFESEMPDIHKKYLHKSSHRRFIIKSAS